MNSKKRTQEVTWYLPYGACLVRKHSCPFMAAIDSRLVAEESDDIYVAAGLRRSLAHPIVVYPCSRFGEYDIYVDGHLYGSFRIKGNTLVGWEATNRHEADDIAFLPRTRELLVCGVNRFKRYLKDRSCVKGGSSLIFFQEVTGRTAFLSALLAALP